MRVGAAWTCALMACGGAATTPEVADDAVPVDVLAALADAVPAVIEAAAGVRVGDVRDLWTHAGRAEPPRCVTRSDADGALSLTATCDQDGDGVVLRGEITGTDTTPAALDGEDLAWARRWVGGELDAPDGASVLRLDAAFLWADRDGPWVRMVGVFGAMEAEAGPVRASRVWAAGAADDRFASPDSWTGGPLEVEQLEVGRVRGPDGVLLTVDGALSGFGGRFAAADVVGGAARDQGCAEPEGTWSLRDEDGRWYDVTFDPDVACDGCGEVTAVGRAPGRVCVADDRIAASLAGVAAP